MHNQTQTLPWTIVLTKFPSSIPVVHLFTCLILGGWEEERFCRCIDSSLFFSDFKLRFCFRGFSKQIVSPMVLSFAQWCFLTQKSKANFPSCSKAFVEFKGLEEFLAHLGWFYCNAKDWSKEDTIPHILFITGAYFVAGWMDGLISLGLFFFSPFLFGKTWSFFSFFLSCMTSMIFFFSFFWLLQVFPLR